MSSLAAKLIRTLLNNKRSTGAKLPPPPLRALHPPPSQRCREWTVSHVMSRSQREVRKISGTVPRGPKNTQKQREEKKYRGALCRGYSD